MYFIYFKIAEQAFVKLNYSELFKTIKNYTIRLKEKIYI